MTREARIPKPAAQQEVCLKRSLARKGQARTLYRLGQGGEDPNDKRGQGFRCVEKESLAREGVRAHATGWGSAGKIRMTREARVPKPSAQQEVCLKRKCGP
jgi:hypothetical protein